jgi:two-component system chemotaxis response regulator CheB
MLTEAPFLDTARVRAVAIGASAGATEALRVILPALPVPYPVPIFLVVHVPKDFGSAIIELFAGITRLGMVEAVDKQPIAPGSVYVAPPDYHLLVEPDGYLSLSVDDPVLFSRPAIDPLLESAAVAYGEGLVGVVLTGASEDGARGLLAVRKAGGQTIAQDPNTARMATMPAAAVRIAEPDHVLSLTQIRDALAAVRAPEDRP